VEKVPGEKKEKKKKTNQKQRTTEFSPQLLPTSISLLQFLDWDPHLQTQRRRPIKKEIISKYYFLYETRKK
jgi:hypothetical protein